MFKTEIDSKKSGFWVTGSYMADGHEFFLPSTIVVAKIYWNDHCSDLENIIHGYSAASKCNYQFAPRWFNK